MNAIPVFSCPDAALDIAFESRKLRDICENRARAESEFGDGMAKSLRTRLADLVAARTLADLPTVLPEPTTPEELAIPLRPAGTLVITANHPGRAWDLTDATALQEISRIRILRIEHGA